MASYGPFQSSTSESSSSLSSIVSTTARRGRLRHLKHPSRIWRQLLHPQHSQRLPETSDGASDSIIQQPQRSPMSSTQTNMQSTRYQSTASVQYCSLPVKEGQSITALPRERASFRRRRPSTLKAYLDFGIPRGQTCTLHSREGNPWT